MPHRLLVPPVRRLEGRIRLPMIQHPGERIIDSFLDSMITRDSLRHVKPTGQHKAIGPLPAVQAYTLDAAGAANAPVNIQAGLRVGNARRVSDKTRGQSAGV